MTSVWFDYKGLQYGLATPHYIPRSCHTVGPRYNKPKKENPISTSLCQYACLSVCFHKTRQHLLRLPPWEGSKPPGIISSQTAQLPLTVLPKVQHRPETLYVPTELDALQVEGLARTCGLTQALDKCHGCFVLLNQHSQETQPVFAFKFRQLSNASESHGNPGLNCISTGFKTCFTGLPQEIQH